MARKRRRKSHRRSHTKHSRHGVVIRRRGSEVEVVV